MVDEATTRWLDEDEQAVWREFLEATLLLWERLARELADVGLSMPEYELLVRLSEAPGWQLRMSELAGGLVHSRSRLTHTIGRMEARGLVERRACPSDKRGVLAAMTEAGHEVLVAAAPTHVTGVRQHLFDQLTAEQVEALGSAMAVVGRHLREA
jgi:DNA-binding MarR family transcriptional regulator